MLPLSSPTDSDASRVNSRYGTASAARKSLSRVNQSSVGNPPSPKTRSQQPKPAAAFPFRIARNGAACASRHRRATGSNRSFRCSRLVWVKISRLDKGKSRILSAMSFPSRPRMRVDQYPSFHGTSVKFSLLTVMASLPPGILIISIG